MAVTWITKEPVYVGDIAGNARTIYAGVVRIDSRTKFGLQLQDRDDNKPDYTTDLAGLNDVITEFRAQLRHLIAAGGL